MVSSKFQRAAPIRTHLEDFEVLNARASTQHARHTSAPYYHGGGWLPANPTLSTRLLVPYALAAPRWVVRTLTSSEYLQVYDFPVSFIPALVDVVEGAGFPPLVPGLSLFYGAVFGFDALSRMGNGGGSFSSPSHFHRRERKREDSTAELRPMMQVKRQKVSHAGQCGKLVLRGTFDSSFDKLRDKTMMCTLPSKLQGKGEPMELDPKIKNVLDDIQREKRERKATKADDAEVPIYLWTEHYMEESTYEWTEISRTRKLTEGQQRSVIEWAMETLRHYFAIRRWKKSLTTSFFKWLKCSTDYPVQKDKNPIVDYSSTARYQWTPGGKDEYIKWRGKLVQVKEKDWSAAADAIERGANSTWWEWQDGSRPFHWRWPKWYQATIRDGLPVYLDQSKTPMYMKAQKGESDPKTREAMKRKLKQIEFQSSIDSKQCMLR